MSGTWWFMNLGRVRMARDWDDWIIWRALSRGDSGKVCFDERLGDMAVQVVAHKPVDLRARISPHEVSVQY